MERMSAGLVLLIIFSSNSYGSSALIKINERKELDPLPEYLISLDTDNSITSSRSKRQIVPETATNVKVDPPIAAAPPAENQPTAKATNAAPIARPATTKLSTSDISGVAANAIASGINTIDQLSQVGDRIGQRLKEKLDKWQSAVDTYALEKADFFTDLFKTVMTTGAKISTAGLKLPLAKLRLPLDVIG